MFDVESLVVYMLDGIEKADNDGMDEIVFKFDKDLIKEIAEAYRKVDGIEIW